MKRHVALVVTFYTVAEIHLQTHVGEIALILHYTTYDFTLESAN